MPKSCRAVCDKCAVVITAGEWQKLSDYRLTQNPTESSHVTSYLMCTEELICTHTRLHTEVQTKLPATLFCCTHGWDDLLSWFAFAHMHTQKQAWKIKHMRYRSEHGCAQSIYRTPPPTQITQVSFIVSWWYAISVLQMFFLIYFSQASHTVFFYFIFLFNLSKWKEVELLLAYTVKKQCWGLRWWHLCGRLYLLKLRYNKLEQMILVSY